MSEVKRYDMAEYGGGMDVIVEGDFVLFEDFNRVTAELDAALAALQEENERLKYESFEGLYSAAIDERDALQQRLTTAYERVDLLEGLLRRSAAFTHDLQSPISLRRDIDEALKPAEGRGDD